MLAFVCAHAPSSRSLVPSFWCIETCELHGGGFVAGPLLYVLFEEFDRGWSTCGRQYSPIHKLCTSLRIKKILQGERRA